MFVVFCVSIHTDGQPGSSAAEVPCPANKEDGLSRGDSYEETSSISTVQGNNGVIHVMGMTGMLLELEMLCTLKQMSLDLHGDGKKSCIEYSGNTACVSNNQLLQMNPHDALHQGKRAANNAGRSV